MLREFGGGERYPRFGWVGEIGEKVRFELQPEGQVEKYRNFEKRAERSSFEPEVPLQVIWARVENW